MNTGEELYMKTRQDWRRWLQKNYLTEKVVWLVYYKKHSDKPSVSYPDAVEEALCFGWIDGQIKRIDDDRYMQRYTPRTSKSMWSELNIERAEKMITLGKMTDTGLKIFKDAMKANKRVPSSKKYILPGYLKKILKKNKKAWDDFQKRSPSVQMAYARWIDSAKTEATRQKRIDIVIYQLERNIRPDSFRTPEIPDK